MDERAEWLGVYMTDDGPINLVPDMPREQMWFVLKKLIAMEEGHRTRLRERHSHSAGEPRG